MKKHYFLGLLALGLMTSCQEEEIFEKGQFVNSDVVVRATLDESSTTRTQLTSNENNNGYKVLWAENDALSIFSSNSAHAKFVLSKGAGEANADFKFESGDLNFATEDGSNDFGYVGVYPYSESTTISKNGIDYVINTAIPTEQAYAVNSFGQDASPMVAVDPSLKLSFKNVGSILVLPLKGEGTITSATLKSKSKKIAGTATVTVTEEGGWIPTVDVTDGESEVVLTCGEGVTLNAENATNFFFVLAPGTYEANDLVITFNNADGKYFETTITAENTFERSKSVKFSERTFAVTGTVDGVTTEDALRSAIDEGKTKVTLDANITLTDAITINKAVTIDLNGFTIENKSANNTTQLGTVADECIVFYVDGSEANLTLNATNGGKVIATGDGSTSYYNVAVWVTNEATATINGGEYSNTADPANDGCDLIYGRDGGKIYITGGTFKAGAIRSNLGGGIYGVLNCKDTKGSVITVSGGKFYEYGAAEAAKVGDGEVILLEGGYYWSAKDAEGYYTVTDKIETEEALKSAIAAKVENITLGADITLSDYIEIRDIEVTINLNGKNIVHPSTSSAKYKDVFEVYGSGNLTIQGDGQVIAEDGYTVYAAGDSEVTLNGGYYFSPVSTVDARKNAKVTINGGEFKVDGTNNSDGNYGQKYTLNLRDKTGNYTSDMSCIIVKGGKFYKYNPAESKSEDPVANFVAAGYSSVANGDYYEVKEGIFNETALNAAIANSAEITLNADMTIEKAITIPTGIAATINLNGFDVTAPNTDAFEVAGTLTIKDTNNEGVVSAGTANPNASVCAVWANGGTVTIDGGHYKVYSDAAGKRNDCIYAGYNADNNNTAGNITINGGKFEYVWPLTKTSGIDYNGDMFLLNCADKDLHQTVITVNGGQFKNNAPSYEATTPQGRTDNEVKLGDGKKVYNGETEVIAAHNGTTDIWYVVK